MVEHDAQHRRPHALRRDLFMGQQRLVQQATVDAGAQRHVGVWRALELDQHIHALPCMGLYLPDAVDVAFAQSLGHEFVGHG